MIVNKANLLDAETEMSKDSQLNPTQLNSNDNSLLESINKLKNNSVFQMSLGSKELFHSNVLAWILTFENWQNKIGSIKELFGLKKDDKIIYVFREKLNLDLLIVYGNFDDGISRKLKNAFNGFYEDDDNQTSMNEDDAKNASDIEFTKGEFNLIEEKIRFIIVENKLKSIPTDEQLVKYEKYIEEKKNIFKLNNPNNKKWIKFSSDRTTTILFAPQMTHEGFAQKGWKPVSYEEYLEKLEEVFSDKNPDDKKLIVIKKYIEMLKIIVNEVLDEILESDLENPMALPNQKNVDLLNESRIGDLYTKIWYSACLEKINKKINGKKDFKNLYDYTKSGFTNSRGLFDWKKKIELKNGKLFAGVQIQHDSFRISVEPFYEGKEKFKFTEKNNDAQIFEEVKDWEENILKNLDKKQEFLMPPEKNQDILKKFGDFKIYVQKNQRERQPARFV